jgi:hypothetical protein
MMMTQELTACKAMETFQQIESFLQASRQRGERLDQTERGLLALLLEMGRRLLQDYAAAAGQGDAGPELEHQGRTLRRSKTLRDKRYCSVFGEIAISRYVYARGVKKKIERALVDEQLGLPAGEQSYVLEDWVGRLASEQPYATAVQSLEELLGLSVSVRGAEVMVRMMAEHAAGFRQSQPPPPPQEEAEILAVTADAKGVPMRRTLEQRRKDAGLPPGSRYRPRLDPRAKRRGRGGRKSHKQMAYVGAEYTIAPYRRTAEDVLKELDRKAPAELPPRPRPQHKRLRACLTQVSSAGVQEGLPDLFAWLAEEIRRRDPQERKTLVCLMDGQEALWKQQQKHFPRAIGILDLLHVLERLWETAYCFHAEGSPQAQRWVNRYLRMLLEGKVATVVRSLRCLSTRRGLKGAKLETVRTAARYFRANREHMRYDQYLAAGYPIGSGVVEGACRHLVKDRMEQSGMRWEHEGAQAVLDLRAVRLNGDWAAFLDYRIQQEQQTLYRTAA